MPHSAPLASNTLAVSRGSNHIAMRQFNERVVLQAIRAHGSLPKADLARATGLTAQTVGLITTRLEIDGLIIKHEPMRGRIGQPSVPLALNPDGAFSIGIKVGRRNTDWFLVDFVGKVRARSNLPYLFPSIEELLPACQTNIHALSQSLGPLKTRLVGVGVAAPFQLGGWHSLLGLAPDAAQAWNQLDLSAAVQAMTDVPVHFLKDTAAACVAELVSGRGRELSNYLYLFVDTFVGGGLVINSHLHNGAQGNAGAVASLPLGLSQAVAQASSAKQHALPEQLITRASLWELEQRLIAQGLDAGAAYDARILQAPYAQACHEWLSAAANALALCITSSSAFLDMEAVVLDGSCCAPLLQQLLTQTEQQLQTYSWEGLNQPHLYCGNLGSDARALGAALLPLHSHFAPDRALFLKP